MYENVGFSGAVPPQPLLPLLLAVAGRALKVPFGEGVFVSLMRLLSAIVSGCNVAARQVSGGILYQQSSSTTAIQCFLFDEIFCIAGMLSFTFH